MVRGQYSEPPVGIAIEDCEYDCYLYVYTFVRLFCVVPSMEERSEYGC